MNPKLKELVEKYKATRSSLGSKERTILEKRIIDSADPDDRHGQPKTKRSTNLLLFELCGVAKGGDSERCRAILSKPELAEFVWPLIDAKKLTISTAKDFVQEAARSGRHKERLEELIAKGRGELKNGTKKRFNMSPHQRELHKFMDSIIAKGLPDLKAFSARAQTDVEGLKIRLAHTFLIDLSAYMSEIKQREAEGNKASFFHNWGKASETRKAVLKHAKSLNMDPPVPGESVDPVTLKKLFFTLSRINHPDVQPPGTLPDVVKQREEAFKEQSEAYEFFVKYNERLREEKRDG